jgi:transcriptional regulator
VHPNRHFQWEGREEVLAFVQQVSFAHLFVQGPEGPLVAHVPVVVTPEGNLRFHLALSNPITGHIEGAVALASIAGPEAYISPDWYGEEDQVPTWNYVTAEVRGPVRRLSREELAAQVDDLSAEHERRLLPKKPWTSGKTTPGLFDGLLKAIAGFELHAASVIGTRKLGQNKPDGQRKGAIAGLRAAGNEPMAELMPAAR